MKKILFLIKFIVLLPFFSTAYAANEEKIVYFYNWSEYVPNEILEDFTKETGIKVIYSTFESNETMYAKLKTNPHAGYDLVVPSNYFIRKMSEEGMLQKIDKTKLKNFKHLDPLLLHQPFDPNNDYSIPYIWGATGIGVNSDVLDPATVTSWADLWNSKYKDKVLMLDDARDVFCIALKKLNYSANSTSETEILAAFAELKELLPNVRLFNSDAPAVPFIEGEVDLGMIWNGSAYLARQDGVPVQFIWPKEGGILWMDNLAITANADHVDNALILIDYLLRPEIAAKISGYIGYPTPNLTARSLLPENIRNDTTLYPTEEIMKSAEWVNDVGQTNELYEKLFLRLKAGS